MRQDRTSLTLTILLLSACGPGPEEGPESLESNIEAALSAGARRSRAEAIRGVAASRGFPNAALLAGIADAETHLAHCWSEATWACQGPWSSSCGGPVIAGAGDGPCSIRQGGLGMFQFDGGNHDQTLARDGREILTLEGNISRAVEFVVAMVIRSRWAPEAVDEASALAWLASVPVDRNDARYQAWINTVTYHYNGCPPGAGCWSSRWSRYDQLTRNIYDEMGGGGFWGNRPAPPPPPPPPPPGESCGILWPGQQLAPGEGLHSCDERYFFVHQHDGNVVLYRRSDGYPLWHTRTHGQETAILAMQGDGNLVLYAPGGRPLWATGTHGHPGAFFAVQDDTNLVVYAPGGRPLWSFW